MTLEFRKQNPLDVSLPTVSPSFGAQTAKAQGRFAEIVQEGSRKLIQANAELDAKQFNYEAQEEYSVLATKKKAELLDASVGGKMEDGRQANEHFDDWSQQWLKERNKGAPNDLANRSLSQSIGNLSAQTRANMIPKEIVKKKEHNRQNQLNITETAANEVLNMSPDAAFEETDSLIDLQTLNMEDLAGDVFSAEEAAEYTKKYGNKLAVSALENFVNNERPDLIIKSLGPELNTKEGKAWLKQNGIDPESLPKTEGNNAINMNVSPAQKSNYLKKAIKMMQAQDVKDNGILQRRVNNFMTSQKIGKIDENQSLDEFKAIEKELFALDSFGKPKYKAGYITDTLLKMTGANVQRRMVQKLHSTPNGKLSGGAKEIDKSVSQHIDELKERYKDNPEVLGYLNSPTVKDSMAADATREYFRRAKEVYDLRMKDSSSYLSQNDEEVMKLTDQVVKEIGATGAINPATMSQYLDTLGKKADELGIPKMAQTMMPEEVMSTLGVVAKEFKTKYADGGAPLANFIETLKQGVPPEKWQDFKDVLKDEHGMKEEDFYASDNFDKKEATYWQKLNNEAVSKALKDKTAGTELSANKVRKKLTDPGSFFGLWGKGVLAKDSPLTKALVGPGGEIRNIEMQNRMEEMAIKSYQYEVLYNGKDEDEAMEVVEKKLSKAFPTVEGKHGMVIVPNLDEHGQEQVKEFLDYGHKVSHFNHNFSKYPNIQRQMKKLGLATQEQQNKYLDENYEIVFGNSTQGRVGAYLKNKGDGTTIPFDINNNGKPEPLEFDLTNSKSLEKHVSEMKDMDEAKWAEQGWRGPSSVDEAGERVMGEVEMLDPDDPMPITPPVGSEEYTSAVRTSIADETYQRYRKIRSLVFKRFPDLQDKKPSDPKARRVEDKDLPVGEYLKQSEAKEKNLNFTAENIAKLNDKIMALPEDDPTRKLWVNYLEDPGSLGKENQYQLRTMVLGKLQKMVGNISKDVALNFNPDFTINFKEDKKNGGGFLLNYRPPYKVSGIGGHIKYSHDSLLNKLIPGTGPGMTDETKTKNKRKRNLLRGIMETESSSGIHRFDSVDNKSYGMTQFTLHQLMKNDRMKKAFVDKYLGGDASRLDGIDQDVLTHNDKLNIGLAETMIEHEILPKLKNHLGDKWDTLSEDDQDLLIYNYYNTGGPDKNKGDPNASMGDKALWRLEKVKQREKYEKMMGVIRHNNKEKKKKDRNPRYTPRYKPEREARAYINSLSQNEKKAIKSGMINNLYHFKKNNMVSGRTPQSLEQVEGSFGDDWKNLSSVDKQVLEMSVEKDGMPHYRNRKAVLQNRLDDFKNDVEQMEGSFGDDWKNLSDGDKQRLQMSIAKDGLPHYRNRKAVLQKRLDDFNKNVKPKVEGAFGDEWETLSSEEKERIYNTAFKDGLPNSRNRKAILKGRAGRTPQSLEINTPDAQSDKTTQGAQSIVEGTMEEINERLMALMPDIMDEINEEIHRGPQSFSGRVDPDDIYEPIMKDEDVSEVNNPIMKNDEFSGQDTWGGQVESPSGSRTKEPYKE